MSLLWTIPPLTIALGSFLALVQLRGMAEAAADLEDELQRFTEVRLAVAQVRSASAETRATARQLRRG